MMREDAPPETRTVDVVDDYGETKVADPYRWLESSDDPEVGRWVEAQNRATRAWLAAGDERARALDRLRVLWNYPKVGLPAKRGGRYFFQRNEGLQNQPSLWIEEIDGGERRVLLDPNELSDDGTVALTNVEVSRDGSLLAYGLSTAGSDWQEIRVRQVEDGRDREDRIEWVRFSEIAWSAGGEGFYYARYPEGEDYFQKLYYHRLGDPQREDRLIYERPEDRLLGVSPRVTEDGRYLLIHVFKGTDKNNEIFVQRLDRPDEPIQPLVQGFDASYRFLEAVGDTLYFRTDREAPRGRIVAIDARAPGPAAWRAVVGESDDVIDFGVIANRRLFVAFLHRAHHRLRWFDLDGGAGGVVELPALGSVTGLSGRPDDDDLFVGFTSWVIPTTSYRFDFHRNALAPFHVPEIDFDAAPWTTEQVSYRSKDGTEIPMFLVHAKDVVRDGNRPVRLYGYGGFNISITPTFNPTNLLWLERGGLLAWPSLRGGAEFGEEWHAAGMRERKQNVFDDFQAAAEWLIAEGYTRPRRIAIQGGSNGGLLTGACLVQRPDLFGAVVIQVPVLDMLRYHLWTIGRYWIPEYGSAEEPSQLPVLLAYSPYHNLREAPYPPVMITTADTDDRVHPAHARKFAARLQALSTSGAPALLRVETRAGHGLGKPTEKVLEEAADIFAFLFRSLGM